MLEKCNRKMRFAIRLLDELNKCKKGIHEPRARFYYIKINCNPGTQGQLLQSNCSELQKKLQFLGSFLKTKFQMVSLKCRKYVKHINFQTFLVHHTTIALCDQGQDKLEHATARQCCFNKSSQESCKSKLFTYQTYANLCAKRLSVKNF